VPSVSVVSARMAECVGLVDLGMIDAGQLEQVPRLP
jgi:hypothetical protein